MFGPVWVKWFFLFVNYRYKTATCEKIHRQLVKISELQTCFKFRNADHLPPDFSFHFKYITSSCLVTSHMAPLKLKLHLPA